VPDHREQVWSIAPDRWGDGFVVTAFDRESDLFDPSLQGDAPRGLPFFLSSVLERTDPTVPRWSRRRVESYESEQVGRQLWNALPAPLQHSIEEPGSHLDLKIATNVAAVADLPWEWLSDGSGQPLALRLDRRLVRSVPSRFPVPSFSVELPLKILMLVPNPKDERLLVASSEISTVASRLRPPTYEVRILEDASLEAVAAELTTWSPHVVHYIGHGGLSHGEGSLILNGSDGRSRWVSATELSRLLPSSVRLICLSTCFTTPNYQTAGLSRFGRTQGLVELPTTLANQFPVGQEAVKVFWDAFYDALIEHRGSVAEAVHQARVVTATAVNDGFSDWSSFTLAVRDQTGVPFTIGRASADPDRRRSAELQAQFATQLANDLATQVAALGESASASLLEQLDTEQSRAAGLLNELSKEG